MQTDLHHSVLLLILLLLFAVTAYVMVPTLFKTVPDNLVTFYITSPSFILPGLDDNMGICQPSLVTFYKVTISIMAVTYIYDVTQYIQEVTQYILWYIANLRNMMVHQSTKIP